MTPARLVRPFVAALFCAAFSVLIHADTAPLLGSTVFDWSSLKVKPTPVGLQRAVVNAPAATLDHFEFHITTLNPGNQSHPPHHHPQEEVLVLKEGVLESNINGHRERAGPGSIFFFASHDLHNVTNVGDKPATYYVINFYTKATLGVSDRPASEYAPAGLLHSSVFNAEHFVTTKTETGSRQMIVNSPSLTFARFESHVTTLNPGALAGKVHLSTRTEIIIIKQGEIEATIDGVPHLMKEGSALFLALGSTQMYRNPSSSPSSYCVVGVTSAEVPKTTQG